MTSRNSFDRMRIEAELRKLTALETELASLRERVGESSDVLADDTRLRAAVAPILSDAMREAGMEDHERMASAIAPYVVGTIHTEILNSQDELIEAIHPKLGVLIREAVANAVEELNRKVDEALPVDRWVAAAKARMTGAPAAGFMLNAQSRFAIREALLIERKSGELLAREHIGDADERSADELDEDLLASMIASLQQFATEAFGATGAGDLRRFSFTEDTVYLRTSPTKILAVRCNGVAPPEVEARIDNLLERALEEARSTGEYSEALHLQEVYAEAPDKPDISASAILGRGLAAVATVILAFFAEGWIWGAHQARWATAVDEAVRADPVLEPYALRVELSGQGESVRVAGLLPDSEALERLKDRLGWVGSPLDIVFDIDVIR